MNYENKIAQGLVDEILAVIYNYEESILLPTVLGCLDIVKQQLIQGHMEDEE